MLLFHIILRCKIMCSIYIRVLCIICLSTASLNIFLLVEQRGSELFQSIESVEIFEVSIFPT